MKYYYLISATLGLLVFVSCKKDDGIFLQNHDDNVMMGIMHQMMSKMDTMQKTADPDIDFARTMMMHHQGAIDMANLELQQGKSDTMKRTAQKIINEQKVEIQQFNTILGTIAVDNSDPSFNMEQKDNMTKMGKAADIQLITGDIDNDFATLMIVHHQSGIDNASAYLHHGNVMRLKTMASGIVSSQTKEIDEMADWLKKNKR